MIKAKRKEHPISFPAPGACNKGKTGGREHAMEGKENIAQINKSSSKGWRAAKEGKGGSERARARERLERREEKQRSVTTAATSLA